MKKHSPRNLVQTYLGKDHMGRNLAQRALALANVDGWIHNYTPGDADYDRHVVLVQEKHRFAPLFKVTQHGDASLPRGFVENLLRRELIEPETGKLLGQYGLIIFDLSDGLITLRGCHPDLAIIINETRYRPAGCAKLTSILIEAAFGRGTRPQRVTDESRINAVIAYEANDVNADDLLNGGKRAYICSNWLIETVVSTPVEMAVADHG